MTINRATMANIYHYRGRNNGIKCDGKMYIRTTISDVQSDLKGHLTAVRLMFTGIPSSAQAIWGCESASTPPLKFACYINTDMTVTFHFDNSRTQTTDISLSLNKVYNIMVNVGNSINIVIADEYMTILENKDVFYTESLYPANANYVAIAGYKQYNDDVIDMLDDAYIYDFQFGTNKITDQCYTGSKFKYVFQKNFGSVDDDEVFELNGNTATIYNADTDTWGASRVNINKYISDVSTINTATDKNNVQTYSTWSFSVRDEYPDIFTNDTIVVEYSDGTNSYDVYCFKVLKAFDRGDGSIDVIVRDIFNDLENIFCDHFFQYRRVGFTSNNQTDHNVYMWWSNLIPITYGTDSNQSTTYADLHANMPQYQGTPTSEWMTFEHIFDRMYYVLSLDLVFGELTTRIGGGGSASYTNIYTVSSLYTAGRFVHLTNLGLSTDAAGDWNDFQNANGLRVSQLLRFMLLLLQRRYYIKDLFDMSNIINPDDNDAIADSVCYKIGKTKYIDNRIWNYLTVTDEINSVTYTGYDDTNNIDVEATNKITLPKNLIPCRRGDSDVDTTVFDPTEILALHLDTEVYKEYLTISKTSDLEIDFSENMFKKRNDNLLTMSEDIEEYTEE